MLEINKSNEPDLLICFDQAELSQALEMIGSVVPKRPSHPILASCLISIHSANHCELIAFDLSTSIKIPLIINVESDSVFPVSYAVPYVFLSNTVKVMQDVVSLSFYKSEDTDTNVLIINDTGNREVESVCRDGGEFPTITDSVEGQAFTISQEQFSLVSKGLYCVATDETQQILTGMNLTGEGSTLSIKATDGHRAIYQKITNDSWNFKEPIDVTIPSKVVSNLIRLLGDGFIDVVFGEYSVSFSLREEFTSEQPFCTIVTRLLDGSFPNILPLFPYFYGDGGWTKSPSLIIEIDRKSLLQLLERLHTVISDKEARVFLSLKGKEIVFLTEDIATQTKIEEKVDLEADYTETTICFKLNFLRETVKNLSGTSISIGGEGGSTPYVFGSHGFGSNALLMPMSIVPY